MAPSERIRSNYDRWKPGTKLAFMMVLKRIATDPKFFDATNYKYSSLTWHTVAENLNKEYPHYAKRFTNINVKDRYDRVMKHHKVFSKMANQLSGFVWNPQTFCFDLNEELLKEYELGTREDRIVKLDSNVAKFLSKPGHIDLEYYHRYIYQISEEDLRNDSILNSPSYIEDAISKGILTHFASKPSFFKETSSTSGSSLSDLTSTGSTTSSISGPTTNNSPPTTALSSNSIPTVALNQTLPTSLSTPGSQQHQIGPHLPSHIPNQERAHQSLQQQHIQHQQQRQHQHQQHNHQHQQQHHLIPPQVVPPPHGLIGSPHNMMHAPQVHSQAQDSLNSVTTLPPPSLPPPSQPTNSDLDFSGLMDNQTGIINSSIGHLSMGLSVPQDNENSRPVRKKFKSGLSSNLIQPGLLVDNYESLNENESNGGTRGSSSGSIGVIKSGLSSGEAVIQIHKEFEAMKSLVSEEIMLLRLEKAITHEDFQHLQELQENTSFVRLAYKRVQDRDQNKLLELINVYLNKID